MFIHQWDVISKRLQQVAVIHYRRTKSCVIQAADKLISERGFSLLELIMIMVVTGIISSVLTIPFITGLKQGTHPEIYTTASFLAQRKIEEYRSEGYSSASIGTSTVTLPQLNNRTYTEQVVTEYVEHSSGSFSTSGTATKFIRVTVTISNSDISDVSLWTILAQDFL